MIKHLEIIKRYLSKLGNIKKNHKIKYLFHKLDNNSYKDFEKFRKI